MPSKDTIFALSSGRPPAGIAVVRVSGPAAHIAARHLAGRLPRPRVATMCIFRHPSSGERLDQGLVLRFDAPASSTGEDVVEFQCHGGRAVVDALLAALSEIEGLREAEPGEFTRRAFDNGRIDLTEAEGLADLVEAETESQRRAALMSAEGGLRRQIDLWRERILSLSAAAERAIDYDDDDAAFDGLLAEQCQELAVELAEWLERPRIEPLKNGVMVVVAGPPNAGKSSLLNAIAGVEKAIVTNIAGTTRDSIEVPISLGGLPITLTDTAGLRQADDVVEAIGVERAVRLIETADILIWLGPSDHAPQHPRRILVHPKSDLPQDVSIPEGSLPVSSVTFAGLGSLLQHIETLARSAMPVVDQVVLNRRQAALVGEAHATLLNAASARELILCAEGLRQARSALDRLTGRAGVEDLLDSLFSRFCLGK